jgi:hypothetical protein
MRTNVRALELVAVCGIVLVVGCGDSLSVDVVAVGVDGSPVVSPMEPGSFAVTADNLRDERIVWGSGSSSCQLGLTVEDADGLWHDIDFRECTADVVEQGLDPGESRTETFLWGGWIVVDEQIRTLPSGQYRVRGGAGGREESEPLVVRVLIP